MTDKVQKNQIADILLDFYDEYDSNIINRPMIPNIYAGKILDSLQEEPVSEELKTELNEYIKCHFTIDKEQLDKFGIEEKDYMYSMDKSDILALVKHFINWQKTKAEPTSEELEEAADNALNNVLNTHEIVNVRSCLEMFKFGAKWQQEQEYICYEEAFEDGAKWKKEQMMAKAIDAEVLENYDGKVLEFDDSILDEKLSNCKVFDKVKVIVIKED